MPMLVPFVNDVVKQSQPVYYTDWVDRCVCFQIIFQIFFKSQLLCHNRNVACFLCICVVRSKGWQADFVLGARGMGRKLAIIRRNLLFHEGLFFYACS